MLSTFLVVYLAIGIAITIWLVRDDLARDPKPLNREETFVYIAAGVACICLWPVIVRAIVRRIRAGRYTVGVTRGSH
jgi:hypothetical protein